MTVQMAGHLQGPDGLTGFPDPSFALSYWCPLLFSAALAFYLSCEASFPVLGYAMVRLTENNFFLLVSVSMSELSLPSLLDR